jgi:hypothetical protein
MSDTLDGLLEAGVQRVGVSGYTYVRNGRVIRVSSYSQMRKAIADLLDRKTASQEIQAGNMKITARKDGGVTVVGGSGDPRGVVKRAMSPEIARQAAENHLKRLDGSGKDDPFQSKSTAELDEMWRKEKMRGNSRIARQIEAEIKRRTGPATGGPQTIDKDAVIPAGKRAPGKMTKARVAADMERGLDSNAIAARYGVSFAQARKMTSAVRAAQRKDAGRGAPSVPKPPRNETTGMRQKHRIGAYVPKGRTDQSSHDYTDDPKELAAKFSRAQLEDALTDKGSSVMLKFDYEESVPRAAVEAALGRRPGDGGRLPGAGRDKPELEKHPGNRTEARELAALKKKEREEGLTKAETERYNKLRKNPAARNQKSEMDAEERPSGPSMPSDSKGRTAPGKAPKDKAGFNKLDAPSDAAKKGDKALDDFVKSGEPLKGKARLEKVGDKKFQVYGPDGKPVGEPSSYTTALKRRKGLEDGTGGDPKPPTGRKPETDAEKKENAAKAGVGPAVKALSDLSLMGRRKLPEGISVKKVDPERKPRFGAKSTFEVRAADGTLLGYVGQYESAGSHVRGPVGNISVGVVGKGTKWYAVPAKELMPEGLKEPGKSRQRSSFENAAERETSRMDALRSLGMHLERYGVGKGGGDPKQDRKAIDAEKKVNAKKAGVGEPGPGRMKFAKTFAPTVRATRDTRLFDQRVEKKAAKMSEKDLRDVIAFLERDVLPRGESQYRRLDGNLRRHFERRFGPLEGGGRPS